MRKVIEHPLSEERARSAIGAALDEYRERFARYAPALAWETENRARIGFRAKGVSLSGHIELQPGRIVVDFEVPFLLRPFTGKAVEVVAREIGRWVQMAEEEG
jgi:hypothetical protein